jgi:hypothetical protein
MKAQPAILILTACLAAAAAAGCRTETTEIAVFSVNIPFIIPEWSGPSREEATAMAFTASDPDRRREGINLLAAELWGLEEEYLEKYAEVLKEDEDASVRAAAVRALCKAKDPKYMPNVLAALSDASREVRWDAAAGLDDFVERSAAAPLKAVAIDDESSDVRAAAARALRHYGGEDVLPTLVRCLSDSAFAVRYRAHDSLVSITGQDLGYDAAEWAAAMEELPTAPPAKESKRPWWDLLGLTGG